MPETLTPSAKLLVKLHGKGSRHIELIHETLTIGRKADNALVIEDPAVSGHHARIVKIQAVFFLEDLKSTNGTAINGQPITRHQLHDADVITIGQHRLVFQENATASTAATPQAPSVDLDRTMVLRGTDRTPDGPTLTAKILIVAGKTDRAGIPTHQTGECHWVTRRSGHSVDRMVCPKICGDDRPTRPQLLHQPFSGCEVSARQWHGRCGTTGPKGWGPDRSRGRETDVLCALRNQERLRIRPLRLFEVEHAFRKGLVASVGELLGMRLQTLEDLPASRFECSAEPFNILVARGHQSTSIFPPLHKPLVQLALASG